MTISKMLLRAQDNTELLVQHITGRLIIMNFAIQSNEFEFPERGKKRWPTKTQKSEWALNWKLEQQNSALKIWEANDLSPRTIYPAKLWFKDY